MAAGLPHTPQTATPLAHTRTQPLDVWIEAEVPASTPVFAVFGDSLSSGVEATMPVQDSWPSIYAKRISALPIHYTASGDTMKSWSDPNHFKWRRWEHLTRPDFAIHAMGFNDIGNGADSWELQARHLDTMEIVRDRLTDQVMLAAITPNTEASDERLGVRRSYNHWLAERRAPFIQFHMEVSHDDRILDAAFDVDGSHLNTEGYRRMASTVPSIPDTRCCAPHRPEVTRGLVGACPDGADLSHAAARHPHRDHDVALMQDSLRRATWGAPMAGGHPQYQLSRKPGVQRPGEPTVHRLRHPCSRRRRGTHLQFHRSSSRDRTRHPRQGSLRRLGGPLDQ
ncbi:SGNH/GDSL hydrolase family protein [Brachybacterium sp. Z12]|nr:SGNH/GDSL hydrolase family protein [Brachybacterium sp. Z12]